jgi:hypothetical protein
LYQNHRSTLFNSLSASIEFDGLSRTNSVLMYWIWTIPVLILQIANNAPVGFGSK